MPGAIPPLQLSGSSAAQASGQSGGGVVNFGNTGGSNFIVPITIAAVGIVLALMIKRK